MTARYLLGMAVLLLGLGLGLLVGREIQQAGISAAAGMCAAFSLLFFLDGMGARRISHWLRRGAESEPPLGGSFWGQLSRQIERNLRLRDKLIEQERSGMAQFLSAIDASPNGVLMLDAGNRIEWCNSMAAVHFGIEPQRDIQQQITNLVRTPAFVEYLAGDTQKKAVRVPGLLSSQTLSVQVRLYGEGRKLVLSQDITDNERAEAMRRDFVAHVSHEIRTPLTVLSGFVETLESLDLSGDEKDRVLRLMQLQTTRMQSLVDDLLVLARLEGSPLPRTDRFLSLNRLLEKVKVDAIGLSAGRHVIVFDDAQGVEMAVEEGELHSAIGNLVNNAIRYTPDKGRILVSWTRRSDGSGALEVRDNGIGIAREHIPRLAQRFYRVDASRSRDTGGTGLGLAIVKHSINRHGGRLEIESEPGKGSCFRLVLPAARLRHA